MYETGGFTVKGTGRCRYTTQSSATYINPRPAPNIHLSIYPFLHEDRGSIRIDPFEESNGHPVTRQSTHTPTSIHSQRIVMRLSRPTRTRPYIECSSLTIRHVRPCTSIPSAHTKRRKAIPSLTTKNIRSA